MSNFTSRKAFKYGLTIADSKVWGTMKNNISNGNLSINGFIIRVTSIQKVEWLLRDYQCKRICSEFSCIGYTLNRVLLMKEFLYK
jgi:hypothetical protein